MANAEQVVPEAADVNLKRVSAGVMSKSIKALSIKVGKNASVAEMAGALSGYFAAREAKGEDVGACSECGMIFTMDIDDCPACGTPADGDNEEPAEVVEEEEDEEKEPEAPPPVVEAKPEIPAASKRKKKAAAPAEVSSDRSDEKQTAIEKPRSTTTAVTSEKDLDNAVAAVRSAMAEGAASYWKIGQKLKHIYDNDLWKQRSADGKPAYKSWDKFVSTEIGMHVSSSWDAMRVAAAFDESVVRQVGQSKLALLLKAPEVTQDALLQKAKDGGALREIKREVAAATAKYGPPKQTIKKTKRTTAKAATASKANRAKRVDKITVASIINEPHNIALFTEESLKAGPGKRVRATKFNQKPSGSLILVNGVEMHLRVAMTAKGAVAVVNFKRAE